MFFFYFNYIFKQFFKLRYNIISWTTTGYYKYPSNRGYYVFPNIFLFITCDCVYWLLLAPLLAPPPESCRWFILSPRPALFMVFVHEKVNPATQASFDPHAKPFRGPLFQCFLSICLIQLSHALSFSLAPFAGSDDAVPPHFHIDVLGSREIEDNIITPKHKEGIYSKRANMKKGKMHISVSISSTIFAEFKRIVHSKNLNSHHLLTLI